MTVGELKAGTAPYGGWTILAAVLLALFMGFPATDFEIYRAGAVALRNEGWSGVYRPELLAPMRYHPFVVLCFVPFSLLPYVLDKALWSLLNVGLLAFSLSYLKKKFSLSNGQTFLVILGVIHALTWQIKFLNITIVLLALYVLAARSPSYWVQGSLLAVMVVIKPYLLPVVAPFVILGCWRSLLVFGSTLLAIYLLPFLQGLDAGLEIYRLWFPTFLDPLHQHHFPKNDNQSYFGLLWRLFKGGPTTYLLWVLGCVGVGLLWLKTLGHLPRTLKRELSFYTLVPLILWTGPQTWIHHQILLIPMLAFLATDRLARPWLILTWLFLNGTGELFFGRQGFITVSQMGIPILGYVTVLIGCLKLRLPQNESLLATNA